MGRRGAPIGRLVEAIGRRGAPIGRLVEAIGRADGAIGDDPKRKAYFC